MQTINRYGYFLVALFFGLVFLLGFELFPNERIRNIFIETRKVFEETDPDYFFGSSLFNSFHSTTKSYIIEDELMFRVGGGLFEDEFLETERNLRNLGLFNDIRIEIEDVLNPDGLLSGLFDVYVTVKDRWSLYPQIIIGATGGEYYLGARLKEYNFLGHGFSVNIDGCYVFRSDTTGYEGRVEVEKKRLFRTDLDLYTLAMTTFRRDVLHMTLAKPFRTTRTESAFGVSGSSTVGNDYFVNRTATLLAESRNDLETNTYLDTLKFIRSNEQRASV